MKVESGEETAGELLSRRFGASLGTSVVSVLLFTCSIAAWRQSWRLDSNARPSAPHANIRRTSKTQPVQYPELIDA